MNLLIVESPAKAKKIQSLMGSDYVVKSSVGHVCDLPKGRLGIDLSTFFCEYQISEGKSKVVAGLRKEVARASRVFLATDLDREGEAIAWHLKRLLKLQNYERIVFNEITKNAITSALHSGRAIDDQMVEAQESRRIIDRLVGYLVSPEVNGRSQYKLTSGRVQSVAVRLVVERDNERAAFMKTPYNVVIANCSKGGQAFKSVFDNKAHELEYLQDPALTQEIASVSSMQVSHIETKSRTIKPPAPFVTSTYTQAMSAKHKTRPKQAMALAQMLFESGLITYHRTDSVFLAEEAVETFRGFLNTKGLPVPDIPNKFVSKADAQEAHEAIRITDVNLLRLGPEHVNAANPDMVALNKAYQMIWMRAVSSQMLPGIDDVTSVLLVADGKYQFATKGVQVKQQGWRQLTPKEAEYEESDSPDDIDESAPLPALVVGDVVQTNGCDIKNKYTQPPPLYSEASLTKALERHGIGRPSTYASIMDKILSYGYVELQKSKLTSTGIGQELCKLTVDTFSFMQVVHTRDVEQVLDAIAQGKATRRALCGNVLANLQNEIKAMPGEKVEQNPVDESVKCLDCGRSMRLINNTFWGCTGYDGGCKLTYAHKNDKPVIEKRQPKVIDENAPGCPKCKKGKLLKRKSKKGPFMGCSNFPKCKHTEQV